MLFTTEVIPGLRVSNPFEHAHYFFFQFMQIIGYCFKILVRKASCTLLASSTIARFIYYDSL